MKRIGINSKHINKNILFYNLLASIQVLIGEVKYDQISKVYVFAAACNDGNK